MLTRAGTVDWAVFAVAVVVTLSADRLIFGKSAHVSFREASVRTAMVVSVATLFAGFIWYRMGAEFALTYVAAYLVEESLSVDNLFVFLVIFTYFRVREKHQQRVLVWGITGAVIMRGIFIVAGTALLTRFHWMMYVFGGFLVFTGLKLAFKKDDEVDPESNLALRFARKFMRTTNEYDGDRFFTVKNGVRYATPQILVLIVIEFTDVVFAVDSVPAVLAISPDIYIVYSSNIFAIIGLRALYFMLSGMMGRFHYLDIGLSVILIFIGVKMLGSGFFKIPILVSLGVIAGVLTLSIVASLLRPKPVDEQG
jgi:tellurite resistance protein TerC